MRAIIADDGPAPSADALVQAIKAKGGYCIIEFHAATGHSGSDHGSALQRCMIAWPAALHTP